jgi:hypothetical protein
MDSGGLGALIGVSVVVAIVCIGVAREKGDECVSILKKTYTTYKQRKQPLLPVTQTKPVLLLTFSKQFQMKELVVKK